MIEDTDIATAGWGIVETRANMEHIAEKAIIRLGYQPLVIRYHRLLKGVRIMPDGRRVRSRQDSLQLRPFIPRYLFFRLRHNDDATLIDSESVRVCPAFTLTDGTFIEGDTVWSRTAGVMRVMRNRMGEDGRSRPKLVRNSIIAQIQAAAIEKDETPKHVRADLRDRMDKGETVRVRHPLGFTATLTSLDEKGRARWFSEQIAGGVNGSFDETEELELVEELA